MEGFPARSKKKLGSGGDVLSSALFSVWRAGLREGGCEGDGGEMRRP